MSSASLAVPRRPDQRRAAALSAAIALNLAVLVAALRPMSPSIDALPVTAPAPILLHTIERPPEPPPPPPALEVKPLPVPTPAVPRVQPAPLAVPSVASAVEDGRIPTVPAPAPTLALPSPPATGTAPVEASLAYRQAPLSFPAQAIRAHMQGTVLLRVLVDEAGKPVQVEVERGSGYPLLDRSARTQVLSGWLFQPAMVDGRAVRAWAKVPVTFNLRGG